jgi:hypothetical protein
MPKIIYGQNGVVINYTIAPAPNPNIVYEWTVADNFPVGLGDPFDPKDPQIDLVDTATISVLTRHENLIRQLIRSVRTNAGINTAATTNGLPTSANSPDLTAAQARTAFKALIP